MLSAAVTSIADTEASSVRAVISAANLPTAPASCDSGVMQQPQTCFEAGFTDELRLALLRPYPPLAAVEHLRSLLTPHDTECRQRWCEVRRHVIGPLRRCLRMASDPQVQVCRSFCSSLIVQHLQRIQLCRMAMTACVFAGMWCCYDGHLFGCFPGRSA